jgi:hypothetical protein
MYPSACDSKCAGWPVGELVPVGDSPAVEAAERREIFGLHFCD